MPRHRIPWLKLAAVALAIGGMATLAARDLAPQLPAWQAFAIGLGGALLLLALAVAAMGMKFLVNRFVLGAGGTDTQWLWFPSDPPGRHAQRQAEHGVAAAQDR